MRRSSRPCWPLLHVALVACTGCGSDPIPPPERAPVAPTLPVPAAGEGFQIDEGSFSVESGREALFCMRYPVPAAYGDEPFFLRGVESLLPLGTHHFFMSYEEGVLAAPQPCVGGDPLLEVDDPELAAENHDAVDGKLAFTAAVGDDAYWLPEGYGIFFESGRAHFTTSHHILNLAPDTADLYGVFNVYTASAAEVPHPVNIFNCLLRDVDVPPHQTARLSATCTVPFDLDMVVLSSHAHQYLRRFEMRFFDGEQTQPEVIYESTQWDSPAIVPLEQPLRLREGQGLTFTCEYDNPSDEPVTYGAGDLEEMCAIMSAYAYPPERTNEVPPSLGGVVFTEGGKTLLIDTTDIGGNF
jgi:hypothetical protein